MTFVGAPAHSVTCLFVFSVLNCLFFTCQGEQQIRQCSEVRDSLTRVLHFGPFHGVEISKVTLMKDSCFGDPHSHNLTLNLNVIT